MSREVFGTAAIVVVPPEKRLRHALPGWTGDEKRSCAETAGELGLDLLNVISPDIISTLGWTMGDLRMACVDEAVGSIF